MSRPRIALLGVKFFPSRGGVSRIVEDTVLALRDRYDLTLYCEREAEVDQTLDGVEIIPMPRLPFGPLGVFAYFLLCAVHVRWRGKADLVHIHKTDAVFVLPLLQRRFRCVATSHEAPYRRDKWSGFARVYFQSCERLFMRSKARLTCISRPLCEEYEEKYGRPVEFVPNGVDLDPERDVEGARSLLEAHGVHGEFALFAARRIMSTKGCHTLLEAWREVDPKVPLVIVGDAAHIPSYFRRLETLAADRDVHFLGYVVDKSLMMGLVDQASLFIFPSENEGMSVMLLEVAAMGTPMLCSRIPENSAVFDEGEVRYFEPSQAADLARHLVAALDHPQEMKAVAEAARARVAEEYGREAIAEQWARIYEEELGASPRD